MTRRFSLALLLAAFGCGSLTPAMPAVPTVSEGRAPEKQPPAHVVGGFSADVPPFHLKPGEEREPCWIFPLEAFGPSRFIGGASLTVGHGMHHGNVTTRAKTAGEGIRACPPGTAGNAGVDVAAGGSVLFGSSTQISGVEWQRFPDGMAYHLPQNQEIVARMHYLNPTGQPLTVTPKYRWYTVDEATVTTELAPFIWVYSGFVIPAGAEVTVTGVCDLPDPMHVVSVLPHMHKLGTRLSAGFLGGPLDGKNFLDSPGYDPDDGVLRQYDPSVDLSQLGQGNGLRFACTWKNTLARSVKEGIGDNEMCMVFGYAWPPKASYTALAGEGSCVVVAPGSR
ncbi:MAG: hypothetical protein EXR72_12440 [Myxococcales bacterium]|nr:hypothetical protein [Myxococcales bacterium]